MAGYTGVPFEQQLAMMGKTAPLAQVATNAAEMWRATKEELTKSSASLQLNLKHLENAWLDQAGEACQARGQQSCADIDSWTAKIDEVVPRLTELAGEITKTADAFAKMKAQLDTATNAVQLTQMLLRFQEQGGSLLDQLAGHFQAATGALASAKGRPWSGPGGASGGGAAGTPGGAGASESAGSSSGAGQAASASTGGAQGPSSSSAASASGDGASASAGAIDGIGAGQLEEAGNPTLQGLESGAMAPQATLPPVSPPAPTPTTSPAVAPVIPPIGSTGVGAGGYVPGVRLGSVSRNIPPAASPISTEVPGTNSGLKPPTSANSTTPSPDAARGGTASTGAVAPMSPMMGGLGATAAGGRPAPGSVEPTAQGRGAKPMSTPGLPASLRGKADHTDRPAFTPRARPARREPAEDVDINTVRFLDEEMWQVDQASAEIHGERPKSRRPTDR